MCTAVTMPASPTSAWASRLIFGISDQAINKRLPVQEKLVTCLHSGPRFFGDTGVEAGAGIRILRPSKTYDEVLFAARAG